jgi:pimeloyl-ACP methyl ester carboxylesterase
MSMLDINGKKLYYETAGAGHPLVLIHSALMHSGVWDEQFPVFARAAQVVRYDLYGYGKSAFTDQKMVNHSADLAALLDHLGIDQAYVLGLSMGGDIALSFALDYPERVDGLILVGSGLEGYDYPDDAMSWWGGFIGAAQAGDFPQARKTFIDNALEGTTTPLLPDVRARIEALTANYNFQHYLDSSLQWWAGSEAPAGRLAEIKCPSLVIVGSDDKPVILDIAEVLSMGIPSAQKVVIPGAAHIVNLGQPEAFNQVVLEHAAFKG